MALPNEILLAILRPLAPSDLKSARLVSKIWSLCAAEFLFNVIYISPSKEDIDVFEAITQHPVLSKCVRHLEYDGAEFLIDYSQAEFCQDMGQLGRLYQSAVARHQCLEGYRKYQEQATYQQDVLRSGQFSRVLVRGLKRLASLSSVTLQPHWPLRQSYNYRDIERTSPLARSWNRLYPDPQGWCSIYDKNVQKGPDGARHFLIISSALARAQKQLRSFKLGPIGSLTCGVPPYVFDTSDNSRTGLDITAFSELEHFDITLACYYDHSMPTIFKKVQNLQVLLDTMDRLRSLRLRLSHVSGRDPTLYTHEQIFPASKVWSQLTTLKLKSMSTTASDLLHLLVFQMPELRHLKLGGIKLIEGTWHSVIEGLKQSNRISSFGIAYNTTLVHHSGKMFMSYRSIFLRRVGEYLIHGGHHPCLPPNQSSHVAQNYMMDIEPSLRNNLAELDRTRSEEPDSVARKALMAARPARSKLIDGSQASWEKQVEIECHTSRSNFTL